jgi:hypothetical protein
MSPRRSRLAALLLTGAVVALPSSLGSGSASADPAETNNQGATASHSAGPQLAGVRSGGAAGGTASGQARPSGGGASGNGIDYHGGPVILGTTNVYYIWYGKWAGNSATTILTDLANGIGGSPYFNINTTYYNGTKAAPVINSVHFAGSRTDNYSQGLILSDAGVQAVVSSAISGGLPKDANGVYFVLTSSDVGESSGFLTQYCGWHTSADAMASVLAHELEEAVTDPDLNAWYDKRGNENADKCAWTFGATSTLTTDDAATNGALWNVNLGKRNYLIQRNWVNAAGGSCALQYP